MKYYLPANKIIIECTRDMYINFGDIVYETKKDWALLGVSLPSDQGIPRCFIVTRNIQYFTSCDTYEAAYDCFKRQTD